MLPFRKILCPTDLGETSQQALDVAIGLAEEFNAELCVLHVVDPIGREPGIEVYGVSGSAEDALANSQKQVEEIISARIPRHIKAHALSRLGNTAEEIENAIESERADLLVIATRGLTGWKQLLLRSVTEKAVRRVSCPVLAIHTPTEGSKAEGRKTEPILPLRYIICPTDFSKPSLEAFARATELAAHYNAKIGLVHVVWTEAERLVSGDYDLDRDDRLRMSEANAKLCAFITEETPPETHVHPLIRIGNTAEQIERAAEEEGADMIVIATHGSAGWHHLFYGSVVKQLLRITRFPILVIHDSSPTRN